MQQLDILTPEEMPFSLIREECTDGEREQERRDAERERAEHMRKAQTSWEW